MYGSSILMPPKSIQSKADAMQFAILVTMKHSNEASEVNYEEADKLFKFFCDRVEFQPDSTSLMLGELLPFLEGIIAGKSAGDSHLNRSTTMDAE